MATHIASANGNWTATTTWNDALTVSTCFLNAENGNTAVTTSYVESSAMTPGASPIDGIAVKIASRAASPSGTMSVRLALAGVTLAGTEVTVNVSDLPTCTATSGTTTPVSTAEGGWFFFKFAAPVTPAAATAYTVSAKTSVSSQVNLWRDGTAANWSRILRSSANTGAVSAGDDFVIAQEWTAAGTGTARSVTMDSIAATDYGSNAKTQVTPALAICKGGTLTYSGGIAAVLQLSGYAIVYNGGTFRMGTTTGDISSSSSATLQFDCDVAAGDFGLVIRNGGTATTGGSPRTSGKVVDRCLLNADASSTNTTLTVDTDTGWLNGDIVAIASTSQTASQWEQRTLSGDAGASSFSITAGLTNAHSGTSPTQAEIVLITRNVVIKPTNTARQTFVYCGATSSVTFNWTQFDHGGATIDQKNSVSCYTTTGSLALNYCSANDSGRGSLFMAQATDNLSTSYFVSVNATGTHFFQTAAGAAPTATTIDHFICIGGVTGITLNSGSINVTNPTATSLTGNGIGFSTSATCTGTFSSFVGHSNGGVGFAINSSNTMTGLVVNGMTIWRNASNPNGGMFLYGGVNCTFNNVTAFGNAFRCVTISGGEFWNLIFSNPTFNGDTTFATTSGFVISTTCLGLYVYSGNCSTVSGIKTAMTNDVIVSVALDLEMYLDNTILAGTNAIASQTNLNTTSFIHSQRQDQTNGKHRSYYPQGTILTNTTTFHTASPSEEMQPTSASVKLVSGSIIVACASGKAATPTVYVRKSSSYNGNAPRLIVKRQDSMGVTSDTVLATFSAAADTWQALSGTTVTATEDGAFEFIVDCDGTAGSVFVDDASATTA